MWQMKILSWQKHINPQHVTPHLVLIASDYKRWYLALQPIEGVQWAHFGLYAAHHMIFMWPAKVQQTLTFLLLIAQVIQREYKNQNHLIVKNYLIANLNSQEPHFSINISCYVLTQIPRSLHSTPGTSNLFLNSGPNDVSCTPRWATLLKIFKVIFYSRLLSYFHCRRSYV